MLIKVVPTLHFPAVLDWTPVIFRSVGNFTDICQQPIHIGAKGTIQSLQQIQIGESLAVEDNVITAGDPFDTLDRKTDHLINRNHQFNTANGTIST